MTEATSPTLTQRALQGHAAMFAFSGLVAGSFALGARATPFIDPTALTALRFIFAALLLSAIAGLGPGFRKAHFKAPWRYLVLGACMALYFVLMFEGLRTATSVSTSAVFTLTPVMSAVFGWFLLRQVTTPRIALGLLIGATGAIWVIFRADIAALLAFDIGPGEALFFVGCIAHALYTPLIPRLNRGEPTVVFTAGMLVGGSLVLLIFGGSEIAKIAWFDMPPIVWITLAYLAVVTTGGTMFLVQFAAMRLPASKVMAYTYLTPSFVILWEIALGSALPPLALMGGVVLTIMALLYLLRA